MAYRLLFNGPFKVSSEDIKHSIYWLRLFSRDSDAVAVLTEVPLNPGLPIFIDISDINDSLVKIFDIDSRPLTYYRVLPRGYPAPDAPVILAKNSRTSRQDLVALIGA